MESQFHSLPTSPFLRPAGTVARCPFHDGPLTLDLLLGELAPQETAALDAALDLRSALVARRDASACVSLALRLRHALDGRHYLAFYRVRLWLQRMILVQVRAWRGAEWTSFPLPLNSARRDEIENVCLSAWAATQEQADVGWAQVRFVFRPEAPVAHSAPSAVTAS